MKQFLCEFSFFDTQPFHLFDTLAFQSIRICSIFCDFPVREKVEISSINAHADFRPARTCWNSIHCQLNPFMLDWSRNLLHNPMWNMAVNNISYPIYPLSTRIEKGFTTKIIPFFFVQYSCTIYNLWSITSNNIFCLFKQGIYNSFNILKYIR